MMQFRSIIFSVVGLFLVAAAAADDAVVVKDDDTVLTYDEMAYAVTRWTPQMREAAIRDEGDRLELINLVLANRKVADYAQDYVAERPELQQEFDYALSTFKRNYVIQKVESELEMPDFTALAQERYATLKDQIAVNPEQRISSHILFAAPPGMPRDEVTVRAQEVLDQLRAGADFEEMVAKYSQEPGAAEKKGKFDRWVSYGEIGVSPRYSQGLFSIDKVGEYSEIVNSEFGLHIIRLDGIQEQTYKPFEEVRGQIEKELADEYRRLALKDFVAQFNMGEDVIIDAAAMEAILAPYQQAGE